MSANSIKVSITFSFKGETFSPFTIIGLDSLMKMTPTANSEIDLQGLHNSIFPLLAASIKLDTYSYAYEIMQAGDLIYSDPKGIAINHLAEGQFNYSSFRKEWLEHNYLAIMQEIAGKHLPGTDLAQHSDIKNALLAAFSAGQKYR